MQLATRVTHSFLTVGGQLTGLGGCGMWIKDRKSQHMVAFRETGFLLPRGLPSLLGACVPQAKFEARDRGLILDDF